MTVFITHFSSAGSTTSTASFLVHDPLSIFSLVRMKVNYPLFPT